MINENWQGINNKDCKVDIHNPVFNYKEPLKTPPKIIPNLGSPHFVGRETELALLHEQLQQGETVAISAVAGMGGVGKTELATQYARRYRDHYIGICWFNSLSEVLLFFSLTLGLEIPQKDFTGKPLTLRQQADWCWQNYPNPSPELQAVLVVFDDVTNLDTFRDVIPTDNRFRILITTRLNNLDPSFIQEIPLDVLSSEKALELLQSLLGEQDKRIARDTAIAPLAPQLWGEYASKSPSIGGFRGQLPKSYQLCEALGYLPLGIELVGVYLANDPELSLQEMLQRLEAKKLAEEAIQDRKTLTRTQLGVKAAFELTWEKLDSNAQQVGMFLSLFSPRSILWELVEWIAMGEALEETNRQLNWTKDEVNKGRKQLYKHHILQATDKEGYYRIHTLMRLFLQEKLEGCDRVSQLTRTFTATLVEVAKGIPQIPTVDEVEALQEFISHLEEVGRSLIEETKQKSSCVAASVENDEVAWIFTKIGWFYQGQGQYLTAEPWLRECVEVVKTRFGDNHIDVAHSLNNLAELYKSQGWYSEAEPFYQQALDLYQRFLGDNNPNIATSLNNLAGLYSSQGRYLEAEPLYKQALEMRKRLLGGHPDVASSLNNLAELYHSQGRYSEAEPLYIQALELYQLLLGDNHPNVASSLNNLAGLYFSQGRYNKAEPLYKQALVLYRYLLGENHPDVATSLNNLALLYSSQGRYDEAESLYIEALEMRKRILGDNHPDMAISLNNLAGLYRNQGRYLEAEPFYIQTLNMFKRLLGDNHPYVAQSLNNLASLYDSQGRYSEAEPLYIQALELYQLLLGDNHPDVAISLHNLAFLYSSQGRYSEAEPLFIEAIEIAEKTLGSNHPSTITFRNNFAYFQSQHRPR